jgi:hypothetical protein
VGEGEPQAGVRSGRDPFFDRCSDFFERLDAAAPERIDPEDFEVEG